MEKTDELNGEKKKVSRLTIEELRSYKGFEHFSDSEASEYIDTMETFCIIAYELYKKEKSKAA
ncbi:MAG: hypothetical protein HYU69_07990 [Bacteroidetes bacterium]|nr:hypothetical protein [Bacteroidota bacterium]